MEIEKINGIYKCKSLKDIKIAIYGLENKQKINGHKVQVFMGMKNNVNEDQNNH